MASTFIHSETTGEESKECWSNWATNKITSQPFIDLLQREFVTIFIVISFSFNSVQAKTDLGMGTEQSRMQTPTVGGPGDSSSPHSLNTQTSTHINNNIPGKMCELVY